MKKSLAYSDSTMSITIPQNLVKEFLGIMVLDTLHDAKGYGYLVDHKLSRVTDLFCESIFFHNPKCNPEIRDFVFKCVLDYFLELWVDNISALGLGEYPENVNIDKLREIVKVPIRRIAEREEDGFIQLGASKQMIEAQNYQEQRIKLQGTGIETMSFISPRGVKNPGDYFKQAMGIVDIVKNRLHGAKAVLDMKSSAGLIRTIADPLGYITGLPTYADPGYNMPGMSAIRQWAEVPFVEETPNNHYSGSHEFSFEIKIENPFGEPAILLKTHYFYGVAKDGLDRNNVLINVLDEPFKNTLPRSGAMAEELGYYLDPWDLEMEKPIRDTLQICKHLIFDHYNDFCDELKINKLLAEMYSQLHQRGYLTRSQFTKLGKIVPQSKNMYSWCKERNVHLRTSYLLTTIKNMSYYNIQLKGISDLKPKTMTASILPKLMKQYIKGNNISILAFCDQERLLLEQCKDNQLLKMLNNVWLSHGQGKLVNQINRCLATVREEQRQRLERSSKVIHAYAHRLLDFCGKNLSLLDELDNVDPDDPRIEQFLQKFPQIKMSKELETVLSDYLLMNHINLYKKTAGVPRTGLYIALLCEIILTKKIFIDFDLNDVVNGVGRINEQESKLEALRAVLGKFNGDFGQIMWCIANGHIFTSEDNNTSAMALMLHRIPKDCFVGASPKWGSIHGIGDGSCVDVTISQTIATL